MCSQNAGNAISETQILKHTILGGGQGKWALWQFCPPLKNRTGNHIHIDEGLASDIM
jgi:hypothetical protein